MFLPLILCLLFFVTFGEVVVDLTDANFDEFVSSHEKVLVEFYAPWCGHCKALAPEYEKAAVALEADPEVGTVLAKVDAVENKDLATRFEVQGFPTLVYFTGDAEKHTPYTGGRTEDTIVSWLKKREMPAVSSLDTQEKVEKFKLKDKVVLIGYLYADSPHSEALKKVAETFRESVLTGLVTSQEVTEGVGESYPTLVLYRTFDESPVVYNEENFDEESIGKWLDHERFPLLDMIGPENYRTYVDRELPIVWVAVDPSDEEGKEATLTNMKKYAKQFKGKLSFTWVDGVQYKQHIENLGIVTVPGLIIASKEKKLYKGDMSDLDELDKFWKQYADGTLESFLKSEEIPETNDEPVFVLVGKAFEDVIGHDKDVFVEFYAPWCGHCKRLAPEYEKVGETFKDTDDVIVAKLDATLNDTPEEIQGFPTLIFYPKGSSTGQKYEGARTAEDIIKFLQEKTGGIAAEETETKTEEKEEL